MSDTQLGAEIRSRTESVLVVDDDVRVVELLQITLGGRGYQVLSAYDGETALRTIQNHRPDLVVLDVRLPKRSGFEVLELVRQDPHLKILPIILVSANAATETRLQGLRLGADDYLTKPFSPRELIMKIRRLLDRAQDRRVLLMKNEALQDDVKRHRSAMQEMQTELNRNLNRMGSVLGDVLNMNRAASIDEILDRFVSTAVGGLDFTRLTLLVQGRDGGFRPTVSRGIDASAAGGLRFARDGFLLRVLRSVHRPMRLEEFDLYPEAQREVGRIAACGLTTLVPALIDGEARGLLLLGDRGGDLTLTRFEWKLLEVLGHSIGVALRNVETEAETQRAFLKTTATLIGAVEDRYDFMRGHSSRVAEVALAMGRRLVVRDDELEHLRYGALLHDLGELPCYQELLDGSLKLSIEERERHRRESVARAENFLGVGARGPIGQILRHQHEWWNGTGFPDGLRGEEIPRLARIVSLANAWDALRNDRPHRPAYEAEEALRILQGRASVQFDPEMLAVLIPAVEPSVGLVTSVEPQEEE
ncbi:MAG: response regulator [Candidatus Eisenbacteria bacterium]